MENQKSTGVLLPRHNKAVAHAKEHDVEIVYARRGGRVKILYPKYLDEEYIKRQKDKKTQALLKNLRLNPVQLNLYRVLRNGLKEFDSEALAYMSDVTKESITKNHERCKRVIQTLKYDKYYGEYDAAINNLRSTYYDATQQKRVVSRIKPENRLGHQPSDIYQVPSNISLGELGVTLRDQCDALIKARLLPHDFYDLGTNRAVMML